MIAGLLGIVAWLLRLVSLVVLVYCVLSFVLRGHKITATLGRYVDPVLAPFRELLYRFFPRLRGFAFDLSPLVLWLVIDVLTMLVNLLRGLFS